MRFLPRPRLLGLSVMALFSMAAFAACSSGVPEEEVEAKDEQIATLQSQVSDLQRDARYWSQLTNLLEPVQMPSMTDHRAFMLPSGVVLAVHHDNMDLSQAKNLNWLAWGVPGRFCQAEQEQIEALYGEGFTHFHDMTHDTHGSAPGAEGVWFVHIAVRDFDSPMSGGQVSTGIDHNFMPTPAPECA